jgi:vesicle-associated membrane protein 7
VVADEALGRRVPFGFLVEIRRRFLEESFPEARTDYADLPNYGAASFNGELRRLMVEYGTTSGGRDDAISNVRREIDDVRGIMTRNIEGLLERGERIDLLVDKTDRLGGSAREFRVRSRGLKRKMWWKNVKLMALLGLVLALIVLAIVIAIKNATG